MVTYFSASRCEGERKQKEQDEQDLTPFDKYLKKKDLQKKEKRQK